MQLKGLVRFFAIALILISLYQLSFTFVVRSYEKKVEAQAKEYVLKHYKAAEQIYPDNKDLQTAYQDTLNMLIKARMQQILDSTSNEVIYNTGIKKYTYLKAKEQELNLGLDLQGGMNVVLEVSLEDLIRSMAGNSKDPVFNKALQLANERKSSSQSDFVTLFGQTYEELQPNGRLAPLFSNAFQKKINYNSSNSEVLNVIRSEATDAIKRTYNVLLTRIDKFGVTQPNLSLDERKGLITVELPGVDNAERVRKYLQATAKLEFWETYENGADFYNTILMPMNEAIKNSLAGSSLDTTTKTNVNKTDTTALATNKKDKKDTTSTASLSEFLGKNGSKAKTSDSASLAQKQIEDQTKAAQKEYPLFAIMQPMMDQNGRVYPGPVVGQVLSKDTALFNRYLQMPAVQSILPKNLKFLFGADDPKVKGVKPIQVYAIKTVPGSDEPKLAGDRVVDARQDNDQNGAVEISMTMDNLGARIWRKMTADNVGKYIAIVLDNTVYSAPRVNGEIAGGRSSITGNFTIEEAKDLANILKSGKLPAPARIVQEQIVGPTLGKESITAGAKSFIISFVVIFILMMIYYNTGGMVANIALILNLLFTVGVLAALGATLTMPGIAGLVLTIGMAVDTNVIIFERIKEELSRGKSYQQAVTDGYKRSYAPVLDAHVTTFLTALILFYFGLGPVLGFATTQMLGIILSLFCGILVSRLITDWWTNKNRHFEYFTPLSRRIFKHASFKFIENRRYAYMISCLVLVLGVGSFFHGFDKGVDFSGGRSYTVRFDRPLKTDEVRDGLKQLFGEYPVVKTIGSNNQLNITTSYLINQTAENTDSLVQTKLFEGLKKFYPAGVDYNTFSTKYVVGSQKVSPTISDDLRAGAVKATILALLAIFAYILLRFRKWQYSLGTIIALLHDVLVTLAVFSFFKGKVPFALEIDQHFIAAILTVIGFSMNDTVIVFDRIREYFREMKGADKSTVINKAINDTLSRTIMTSLTVFLTILILFIFGGEVTRGFAFAMLIGVITGTYSSIFVAAPVLVDFDKKNELGTAEAQSIKAKAAVVK